MQDIASRLKAMGVTAAVDCHLHPWSKSNLPAVIRGAASVRPDLVQDYSPGKVVSTAKANGFASVILVHARDPQDDAAGEAQYFLEAAREYKEIVGAVVGIDLLDPTGTEQRLKSLCSDPVLRGARMIQPEASGTGILGDARCKKTTQLLGELGLSFDLLLRCSHPGQLEEGVSLVEWLAAHSRTRVVGDHLLKPLGIPEGKPSSDWLQALNRLAACPNFFMKVSGLPGEVSPGTSHMLFRPFYDAALKALGPDRLIFGSDHPVSYGYSEAVCALLDWLEASSLHKSTVPKQIFQTNAQKAYSF